MITRSQKLRNSTPQGNEENAPNSNMKKRKYKGLDAECSDSADSYEPEGDEAIYNDEDSAEKETPDCDDEIENDRSNSTAGTLQEKQIRDILEQEESDYESEFVCQGSKSGQKRQRKSQDNNNSNNTPIIKQTKSATKHSKSDNNKSNNRQGKRKQQFLWKLQNIEEDDLFKIFTKLDASGKGFINVGDISKVVKELMLEIDIEDQENMMKRAAEIAGGSEKCLEAEQLIKLINHLRQK
eukprot:TRINITY_DN7498_c0_g2_i2.p2 TRINITY_DN7498_c0_g2~~TRINITY_DN7498_c0_g2_i2.p2  ORF type:complete len:239 (-),score=39.17 TRINITY_DN7498_c0_g2_i2:237-953(-)